MLDKYFSRKVKIYCDINQLEVSQKRTVKHGRFIFIHNLQCQQNKNSLAFDGISLASDGILMARGYEPIIKNDDMF
jgi:hypothetical protein